MESSTRLSIELPQDLAAAVRERVASGKYASESEVVAEGLALLAERDEPLHPDIEAQLASGYDAWKSDPADVLSLRDAAARLQKEAERRHP